MQRSSAPTSARSGKSTPTPQHQHGKALALPKGVSGRSTPTSAKGSGRPSPRSQVAADDEEAALASNSQRKPQQHQHHCDASANTGAGESDPYNYNDSYVGADDENVDDDQQQYGDVDIELSPAHDENTSSRKASARGGASKQPQRSTSQKSSNRSAALALGFSPAAAGAVVARPAGANSNRGASPASNRRPSPRGASDAAATPGTVNEKNSTPIQSHLLAPPAVTTAANIGSSSSAIVAARSPSRDPSQPSFVELIKAREEQQRRIREKLETQNDTLRTRLETLASMATSGDGANGAEVGSIKLEEFLSFVMDVKDMVLRNHEAETSAFGALISRIESLESSQGQRLTELEARLIQAERTRDLLREEQVEQNITLSTEVEDTKEAVERLVDAVAALQRQGDDGALTSAAADRQLEDIGSRLLDVETLSGVVRQEIEDVQLRVTEQQLLVNEELRKIRERYPDTEERLRSTIARAEESLSLLQQHAENAITSASYQQRHLEELVERTVADMGSGLEALLGNRYTDHAGKLQQEYLTLVEQHNNFEGKISGLVDDFRDEVRDFHDGMEHRHVLSVEAALKSLQERADAFESERRHLYPTAEPARLELMIKELEDAFTVMEGMVRANISGTTNLDLPQVKRIDALESHVAGLRAVVNDPAFAPKLFFHVDTQTAIGGPTSDAAAVAAKDRRLLQDEVAIAASQKATDDLVNTVDYVLSRANTPRSGAGGRGATTSQSDGNDPATASYNSLNGHLSGLDNRFASPAPHTPVEGLAGTSAGGAMQATSSGISGRRDDDGGAQSPVGVSSARGQPHRNGALLQRSAFELSEDLRKKEDAVQRIQDVLTEIAKKFKDITTKEQHQQQSSSPAASSAAADVIASQKAAIYEKERLLIQKRNDLLKQIKDIEREQQQQQQQQHR